MRNRYDHYDRVVWEQEQRGWVGGGAPVALRAYQAYHPSAAIYFVTYNGRTVWMTSKQQAIWHFMRKHTARLLMLQDIAEWVHCSTSTVSRFLHRLERWHFIQLIVLRGPGGGVAAITAKSHLNPLKVVRDSMRIHRTKIAQMRKAFDEIMRVKPETPSTPKVVVRVQLLLENWGFGIGG